MFYNRFHGGARDHDYLDLVAAWLQHNTTSDQIEFRVKVTSTRALESPPSDYYMTCDLNGTLYLQKDVEGYLYLFWRRGTGSPLGGPGRLEANASWNPANRDDRFVPLRVNFTMVFAAPGYYVWRIDRGRLANLGDSMRVNSANCSEGRAAGGIPTGEINADGAIGGRSYAFPPLPRGSSVDEPDWDAPADRRRTQEPESGASSQPAFLAAVGALGALVLARRRHGR